MHTFHKIMKIQKITTVNWLLLATSVQYNRA